MASVETSRKWAPFQAGYLRVCGPIRPITERRSLSPTSFTRCAVSLPCGRDTTFVEHIGLTQLTTKEMRAGPVGTYPPVGLWMSLPAESDRQSAPRAVLATA